jgi:uncharacterized protein involved in exopolysaccharide biosynthesis
MLQNRTLSWLNYIISTNFPLAIGLSFCQDISPMAKNNFGRFDISAWVSNLKRPFAIAFGLSLGVALATLALPNYYQSEVKILPVDGKGSSALGQLAGAAAAFGVGIAGQDGGESNYVDILSSRWLLESLLNTEFEFQKQSTIFGKPKAYRGTLFQFLGFKNNDMAIRQVRQILSASRDLKSKIIVIGAETRSPELSQLVVKRAVKLLEIFILEKGRTRGGAKATFAEARLFEARKEMAEAEGAFRFFLERNRGYSVTSDPSIRLLGNRLEAELKLRSQLVYTLAMNREQALLEEKNDIPMLNVLDAGNLPLEKSRPSRAKIVLLTFILTMIGSWAWINRSWIGEKLGENSVTDEAR